MITNLPTSEDFEKLGKNCLVQAFDLIFETDKAIFDFGEKAVLKDVWAYSQGKLNTAVVLIHQAIEAFMKASICLTSPYLLLDGKRTDWPVLPNQNNRDFNDFYTTPAEALLRTYAATAKSPLSTEIVEHVEAVRTLRNQIVHGISRTELTPKKLVGNVLDTFYYFLGVDAWWSVLLSEHINHPLAEYYDFGVELAKFPERLDYVEASVGKAKLAKQFTQNIKARRYICPHCKHLWEEELAEEYPYSWAFLKNGTKSDPFVFCINCNVESPVKREECYYTDCKGSVVFYGIDPEDIICLTCGQVQFTGTEAEEVARREAEEARLREKYSELYMVHSDHKEVAVKLKRKSRKKSQT